MSGSAPDREAAAKAIDAALADWRQGDLALDEQWFVHVGEPSNPLTAHAEAASQDVAGIQALTSEVEGLVVLTQTCDIVRECTKRPYVEVAPIIVVTPEHLAQIQRGQFPALTTVPALADRGMAVDLDRVMTVEKSIVATWARTPGWARDQDARAFGQALARKRVRFAFPDDFNDLVGKLRGRLRDKHEKNTDEGRGLRALREIRVHADPEWEADRVSVFLWFVREDGDVDFEGKSWDQLLGAWLALVRASGRFVEVEGAVVTLEDMTAADFVASDPLDLEHVSRRT